MPGNASPVLIRREIPGPYGDVAAVRRVHTEAFAGEVDPPVEVGLLDALRECDGWIPELSLVAVDGRDTVLGHVVCTRAWVGGADALGLGPIGVLPPAQGAGVGSALMHAALGAADALGESLVVLLGHLDYYPRFGFRPASEYGIIAPDAAWGEHFQVRTLTAYDPSLRGDFVYAQPYRDL